MDGTSKNPSIQIGEDLLVGYKAIYENSADGISIFDKEGILVWCNNMALEIYGYSSRDEVIGTKFTDYLDHEKTLELEELLERVKTAQDITLDDSVALAYRKDGSVFQLHYRTTPIYSEGEFIGFQSHSRDISELKKTEHRLKTSLSEMELLASLIRHDFGNDLQVVVNALDVALMKMDSNTEVSEFVSTALSGANRMSSLLSLLSPSYSESADALTELIQNRGELAKKMYPDLNIIVTEIDSTKPIAIDSWRLLPLVLDNLIRNSVTYAGPNCTIAFSTNFQDESLRIDVADDGPGIPSAIRERLFQRGTTTSGSGFGVYLCRRILESYGGSVELLDSSLPNTGAAFRITLPVDLDD